MAQAGEMIVNGADMGSNLRAILESDEIQPGSAPSYQVCKALYSYHPLGKKMVDVPVDLAMSQEREVSVPAGPQQVVDAFLEERKRLQADRHIKNALRVARIYGISSLAVLADGVAPDQPLDPKKLPQLALSFNVYDPLNTSGSLVLSQQPLSPDFLKHQAIRVDGASFHRSRAIVTFNEEPLYIEWTSSAFGYVGRSVYQRAFYPMKSFLQSMITDDMVVKKAGLLISKRKQPGSIIDGIMQSLAGIQRSLLKSGQTGQVLSIGAEDAIETLNLQNLDGAFGAARKNIIDNIASAASMPAKLLNSETFAEGFGEGTEDAKAIAHYIDGLREEMGPIEEFLDTIAMHRAWSPEFFDTVKAMHPGGFGSKTYDQAFYEWKNSFAAVWPSLLKEPDSEQVKTDDVKLKAIIAAVEVFEPLLDPENRATLIDWAAENLNDNKIMFQTPLLFDMEALRSYEPEQPGEGEVDPAPPFSGRDSVIDVIGSARGRHQAALAKDLVRLIGQRRRRA